MDFFTSDLHLNHANVIRYSSRPFETVSDMNEGLIARWNERVSSRDTVYLLGDVAQGPQEQIAGFVERLNGQIHLIWGNHDSNRVRNLARWQTSRPYAEVKSGGEHIVLCHYAFRTWNRCHYGAFNFYGHSHGSLPAQGRSIDVGVDAWDYRPVTFSQIKERLAELGQLDVIVGHHEQRDT